MFLFANVALLACTYLLLLTCHSGWPCIAPSHYNLFVPWHHRSKLATATPLLPAQEQSHVGPIIRGLVVSAHGLNITILFFYGIINILFILFRGNLAFCVLVTGEKEAAVSCATEPTTHQFLLDNQTLPTSATCLQQQHTQCKSVISNNDMCICATQCTCTISSSCWVF